MVSLNLVENKGHLLGSDYSLWASKIALFLLTFDFVVFNYFIIYISKLLLT